MTELRPGSIAAFREWFGVTPSEARLLVALYRAEGRPQGVFGLSLAAGVAENAVATHIVALRDALSSEALDCVRPGSYCLTSIGLNDCRSAMISMAADLGAELKGL